MNIRKVVAISGLALLTATPFAANAGSAARATNACAQAFIDAYLPANSTVRVRTSGPAPSSLSFYSRQFTIELSANASATGTELVTARCVANTSGEVLTLNSTSAVRGRVIPGVVAKLK